MKKEYRTPAAELLLFAGDPLCAENSPEESEGSWNGGRFEFPMKPLT